MDTGLTERQGVAALAAFFAKNGWYFREQFTHDWGIDAHVEIVRGGAPTGELIALQIKAGKSYFSNETDDSVPFPSDEKHIRYWTEHSMPVVVVLFHPETQQMYWQHISKQTAVSTGKGWKVVVPKAHSFDDPERSLRLLSEILQPEPYVRRLNKLRVDRRWMERIADGDQVVVEFDDWVNKSLPRYQVTLSCFEESEVLPMTYMPGTGIEGMLEHIFPWAEFSMNEVAYNENSEEPWDEDAHPERNYFVPVYEDGEIERYSLVLSLNELGEGFLATDAFLDADSDEPRSFTLEDLEDEAARTRTQR